MPPPRPRDLTLHSVTLSPLGLTAASSSREGRRRRYALPRWAQSQTHSSQSPSERRGMVERRVWAAGFICSTFFHRLQLVSNRMSYCCLQHPVPHTSTFLSYQGEVGKQGGPGRRELGHGNLAERALSPVIPKASDFPYVVSALVSLSLVTKFLDVIFTPDSCGEHHH